MDGICVSPSLIEKNVQKSVSESHFLGYCHSCALSFDNVLSFYVLGMVIKILKCYFRGKTHLCSLIHPGFYYEIIQLNRNFWQIYWLACETVYSYGSFFSARRIETAFDFPTASLKVLFFYYLVIHSYYVVYFLPCGVSRQLKSRQLLTNTLELLQSTNLKLG